jgi:hypothetical protein
MLQLDKDKRGCVPGYAVRVCFPERWRRLIHSRCLVALQSRLFPKAIPKR